MHYYNLTDMGVTHSGKKGVALWYRNFIVPTLGNQAPLIQELQLDGQIDNAQPSDDPGVSFAASRNAKTQQAVQEHDDRIYGEPQVVQHEPAGVFRYRRAWLDCSTVNQPRHKAVGQLAGWPDRRRPQRKLGRSQLPSHSVTGSTERSFRPFLERCYSAGTGHRSHAAVGPSGCRRAVGIVRPSANPFLHHGRDDRTIAVGILTSLFSNADGFALQAFRSGG